MGSTVGLFTDTPALVFRRGDADGSGEVELADVVYTLRYLFLQGPEPECTETANANDAGFVEISDAVFLLLWLFREGSEPPKPGPTNCGRVATPEEGMTCIYDTSSC